MIAQRPERSARRLVLATSNQDKVAELQVLLGSRYEIVVRPSELADTIEDGETLEDNALKKAREVAAYVTRFEDSTSPQPSVTVADDTGLFVAALGGRPGVHTARYAGPEANSANNVAKLLGELRDQPGHADRRAEFRTVIAAVWPNGDEIVVEGTIDGRIGSAPQGQTGFGYDPVFVPDEGDGRTFAEMSGEEKNRISHRGRAIRALVEKLH